MISFEERKLKLQPTCFSCKHRAAYECEWECFDICYCMLGVSDEDLEHVNRIVGEDEDWDDRFCEIMRVDPKAYLDESLRRVEPDNICQFYEREK